MKSRFYIIELKGNAERVSKPYEQIKITIEFFKQRMNINSIFGIIVRGKNKTIVYSSFSSKELMLHKNGNFCKLLA